MKNKGLSWLRALPPALIPPQQQPMGWRELIPTARTSANAGSAPPHPRPNEDAQRPLWLGKGKKVGRVWPGLVPSLLAPHLLHDEVVEECHHTDIEGLHPLLPEEASEDLEATKLEELLLGIGEVSQHGGQRKESLVGREVHQHWWPWPPPLFVASHGDKKCSNPFAWSSPASVFKPLLTKGHL